jgi:uncharacterized protein
VPRPMPATQPGPTRRRRVRRIAAVVVAALVLVALATFALIPVVVMGPMIRGPIAFATTYAGEELGLEPERVTLRTADGLELAAYWVHAGEPAAVVIFVSGTHGPSVTAFFGHAAMLEEAGYASLLVELRARGESQGERIGLAYEEVLDLQAGVAEVQSRPEYVGVPIVAYGLSLGGATAINAAGVTPAIDGLVSLSAFSSWSDVFVDSMGLAEPLATVQRAFVELYLGLVYGFDRRDLVPYRQIERLGQRPALLIHSRGDSQVPFSSFERLRERAPAQVETWVRDGDAHLVVADGSFLRPWEDVAYAEVVLGFLRNHFDR